HQAIDVQRTAAIAVAQGTGPTWPGVERPQQPEKTLRPGVGEEQAPPPGCEPSVDGVGVMDCLRFVLVAGGTEAPRLTQVDQVGGNAAIPQAPPRTPRGDEL